jgi:hypothetical protein
LPEDEKGEGDEVGLSRPPVGLTAEEGLEVTVESGLRNDTDDVLVCGG